MATTTTVHAQFIKYASNGDQTVLHLENTGADVKINRSSNPDIPSSVTNVQQLVNALGKLAFSDGVSVSGLTTGNFAAGVNTTDLNVSESGKIADARALKTINDKIKSQEEKITALNSNLRELTLTPEKWVFVSDHYEQEITDSLIQTKTLLDLVINGNQYNVKETITKAQICGYRQEVGKVVIYAWGEKPELEIPCSLIVRGGF